MASEQPQEVLLNGHPTSQPATPSAAKANVAALQSSFIADGGGSYDVKTALDDLSIVRVALQLFLESKMVESEDLLNTKDPVK
jgi:tetratricopeptide repeat protein 39